MVMDSASDLSENLGLTLYNAKKAVSLSPSNASYWNALGIVAEAAGEKSLALHAYQKSIELNPILAATWTNLGFLVYSAGDYISAHACFAQAQRFEPSYGMPWIGQGLVAEVLSERDDSTDLFRHAAGLDDTEMHGSLCYGYWVCKNLFKGKSKKDHHYMYTIEHLDAVNVSLEKIALYNGRRPSAASFAVQGILEAEIGRYDSSLRSFEQAMKWTKDKEQLEILKLNEIMVLKSLKRWDDVLKKIDKFEPISKPDQFRVIAVKALALQKRGDLEESYIIYDKLLKSNNGQISGAEKSDLLISQGLVSFQLHGLHKAKTMLFQGCELASVPNGHIALCSLALQENDIHLAQSIVVKMSEKFHKQKYLDSIALLHSFSLLASGADSKKALRSILSYLHKYPANGKLWKVLANHCINFEADGHTARYALLSSSLMGQETSLPKIALTYLLEGNIKEAVIKAQKAFIQNPSSLDSIAILVSALSFATRDPTATEVKVNKELPLKLAEKALGFENVKDTHDEKIRDWLSSYIAVS